MAKTPVEELIEQYEDYQDMVKMAEELLRLRMQKKEIDKLMQNIKEMIHNRMVAENKKFLAIPSKDGKYVYIFKERVRNTKRFDKKGLAKRLERDTKELDYEGLTSLAEKREVTSQMVAEYVTPNQSKFVVVKRGVVG